MSGRKELPVFHYDSDENGRKYLGKFASRAEVFKMYFDGKKGELFKEGWDYKRLPDGSYVTKEKVGREGLRKLIRTTEDPTIYKRSDDKEIEIVNYLGEVIGTVSNVRVLIAITSSNESTIRTNLHRKGTVPSLGNVSFRYKM